MFKRTRAALQIAVVILAVGAVAVFAVAVLLVQSTATRHHWLAQANRAYREALDDPILKTVPPQAVELQSFLRYAPCEGPSSEGPLIAVSYSSRASKEELVSFYAQRLSEQGWRHEAQEAFDKSVRHRFLRQAALLEVTVEASQDTTAEHRAILVIQPTLTRNCA